MLGCDDVGMYYVGLEIARRRTVADDTGLSVGNVAWRNDAFLRVIQVDLTTYHRPLVSHSSFL